MEDRLDADAESDLDADLQSPPETDPPTAEQLEPMENLPEPGVDFPEDFDRSAEPASSRRFYRVGTYVIGVVLLVVIIYVVIAENWSVGKTVNPNINDLVESLDRGGFTVGTVKDLADRGGASSAKEVVLEGHPIHIYQFAITTDKHQKQLLEEIARTKTIAEGGVEIPAKVHGPFVLTHWEDAPYRDDLVRLYLGFGSFGTRTENQERSDADRAASESEKAPSATAENSKS